MLASSAVHIFAEIAVKLEENRVFENAQIEVPGQGGVGGGYTPPIQDYFTRHAGKCAAADPEGFAHSAAAEGRSERRRTSAANRWQDMVGLVVTYAET